MLREDLSGGVEGLISGTLDPMVGMAVEKTKEGAVRLFPICIFDLNPH